MAESQKEPERRRTRSLWTLRLAGGQDDANPTLWSPQVRSTGYGVAGLLSRCRWIILGVFVAALAPAAAWVLTTEPLYEVSLRLFLKAEPGGAVSWPVSPAELTSKIEEIRNPERLQKIVKASGLDKTVPRGTADEKTESAVRALGENLRVTRTLDSSVISVEYANEDPEMAEAVARSVAELALAKGEGDPQDSDATRLFEERTKAREAELRAAQAELAGFRERNRALLLEILQAAVAPSKRLEAERTSTEDQIEELEMRLLMLARQAAELPAKVISQGAGAINEPLEQQLQGLLAVLESQRTELLTRHDPTYPLVRELDQRIAGVKLALGRVEGSVVVDETETVGPLRRSIDTEYLKAQADLAGLRAKEGSLRAARGRQAQLERVRERHAELETAVQTAEEAYRRHQDSAKALAAERVGGKRTLAVSLLEPVSAPALPANRRQPLLLLLSLLGAAGAALGAALLYDPFVKPAAYVADIATATGGPVLVMVEETQSHVS